MDLPDKVRVDFAEITFRELGDALDASGVPDLSKATAGQQARANAAFAWVVLRRDHPDVTLERRVEHAGLRGGDRRSGRPGKRARRDRWRNATRVARAWNIEPLAVMSYPVGLLDEMARTIEDEEPGRRNGPR